MFHQVFVKSEHANALRFLWWPNGCLEQTPASYQMLDTFLVKNLHLAAPTSACDKLHYILHTFTIQLY